MTGFHMKTSVALFVVLFLCVSRGTAGEILQGPYPITNDVGYLTVKQNGGNINCPVDLIINKHNEEYVLDRMCINGDQPNVRSVFFVKLRGENYIGVIVSWYNKHQAEGIDETSYQIMIYKKDGHGSYVIDKDKNSDRALYGAEDGAGDGSYKYNNASAVKNIL